MTNKNSFITQSIIRAELAHLIGVHPLDVNIHWSKTMETATMYYRITAKDKKDWMCFPCADLMLSLDDFSNKHIAPYVSRVYGTLAVAA